MEKCTKLNVADGHQRSCDSYGVVTLGQGHGLLGVGARFCYKDTDYECPISCTWDRNMQQASG